MAKQQTVTVKHENGSEAYVLPASVGLYLRKGWTLDESSLEREGNAAPLTDADKAKIVVAVDTHGEKEGNQEPQAPEGSTPPDEDQPPAFPVEAKDPVVEVVKDPGATGQPGENRTSGESPDSRRRR